LFCSVLQLEIAELQRQEVDIRQEKEDKEREVAEALAPRLASLELSGENIKPLYFLAHTILRLFAPTSFMQAKSCGRR
jgi:hypothetical protein